MKKFAGILPAPKLKLSTGQIIGLSIFALLLWLLGLMPFMSSYNSHVIRVGLVFVISLFLMTTAYLIRRFYYHGTLMAIAISMIGMPLYYLLNPAIPHAEWLFILIVIAVSAQWGVGSGILSAFLSAMNYGILSNFFGVFAYPDIVTDALIAFGYFVSSAFIIGTLSRHRETALRSRAHMADELEKTYDATMIALTQALDARDHDTEGHSQRVTILALKIGKEMGMDETALNSMRLGALLHDVGKIGIPDAILHKPGPLDEREWVLMRQHPQIGYDILCGIKFLAPALDVVRCHHEQYDGSGYPAGLKGETIPLSARIFSVADVYDALTSHRPYRAAYLPEEATEMLLDKSGQHFDPEVVRILVRILADDRQTATTTEAAHLPEQIQGDIQNTVNIL